MTLSQELKPLNRLKQRLHQAGLPAKLLIAGVVSYSALFSTLSILQHHAYGTYAFDLGLHDQVMWSSLHGHLFYETPDVQVYNVQNYVGAHFSPILILLLPLYWLYQAPETLLVIQSVALGLGAIPVFYLSRKIIGHAWPSLLLAFLYLVNPIVQSTNLFDFHPNAFFPATALTTLYFSYTRRTSLYLLSLVATLMVQEFAAVIGVALGIFLLFRSVNPTHARINRRTLAAWAHRSDTWLAIVTLAISLAWVVGSVLIIRSYGDPLHLQYANRLIGSQFANNVSIDLQSKLGYLLILFISVGFLPLLPAGLAGLLVGAPWLLVSLSSSYPPWYQIGWPVSSFIVPSLFLSTILSLRSIVRKIFTNVPTKLSVILLIAIMASAFLSPLNPALKPSFNGQGYHATFQVTTHDALLDKIIRLIPLDASVLAQQEIFPHISGRSNAYILPPKTPVDYVIADASSDLYVSPTIPFYPSFSWIVGSLTNSGQYGTLAWTDGILLLQRGYSGPLQVSSTSELKYSAKDLTLNSGSIVRDPTSSSGDVLEHSTSDAENRTFWFGPYVTLAPGDYSTTFKLKTSSLTGNHLVTLDVFTDSRPNAKSITSADLSGSNFTFTDHWQTFTLRFHLSSFTSDVEFRGIQVSSSTILYLDTVVVQSVNS